MSATGQDIHKICDAGFNPAWSPDGREVVYDTEDIVRPESRYGVSQLAAVEVATGRKRVITAGDAVQPNWSPHGQRIAFWAAFCAAHVALSESTFLSVRRTITDAGFLIG